MSYKIKSEAPELFDVVIPEISKKYSQIFFGSQAKTAVLGLGVLTHDSSAALVSAATGDVLYASAEERLSNVKHDSRFPWASIEKCCEIAQELDLKIESVAVNFKPELFLPGILEDELSSVNIDKRLSAEFFTQLKLYATKKQPLDLAIDSTIKTAIVNLVKTVSDSTAIDPKQLLVKTSWYFNVAVKYYCLVDIINRCFPGVKVNYYPHHDCHAATAWFGSGLLETSILVIDGHGEVDTTTMHEASAMGLMRKAQTRWPASMGSVYLAFTRYLGFDHGDEYKVMGMSAYGRPVFLPQLKDAVYISESGTVEYCDTEYFSVANVQNSGHVRFKIKETFSSLCALRNPDQEIRQEHFNLAASVQALIEHLGVVLARRTVSFTSVNSLAIAGGVALNGLMNEAIRQSGDVSDIFIYPAASDDGTSAGAAMLYLIDKGVRPSKRLDSCYFGYAPRQNEITETLLSMGIKYSKPDSINDEIARAVFQGKIVARYNGASEYGPRALGNRSILANPTMVDMKDILNVRIKHREQFRPFAPACLREHVSTFFDFDGDAPFMIMIVRAKDDAVKTIPAVIHSDGTARVQTVTERQNPDFHRTLQSFYKLSGVPVLINTSFNVNGEAIVDTPLDAIESFAFMDIDYLAIGDFWVAKANNKNILGEITHNDYLELRRDRYIQSQGEGLASLNVRKYESWFYPSTEEISMALRKGSDECNPVR